MQFIMIYNHYPVSSGKYMKFALQEMGHEVLSIGPYHGSVVWGIDVGHEHADFPSFGDKIDQLDNADCILIADSDPNLLFADTQQRLKERYSCPVVVYGVDNHARPYGGLGIDHFFMAHKWPSVVDMTATNVTWLPCGYDSRMTVSQIPWEKRKWDVLLCGVLYPQRETILRKITQLGYKVKYHLGAVGQDYINLYHNSRIALNIAVNYDLSQRVFETAALGCNVLTSHIPDLLDLLEGQSVAGLADLIYVDEVRGVWELHDMTLLDEVIPKLLNRYHRPMDPKWVKEHTWQKRLQVIIDWVKTQN